MTEKKGVQKRDRLSPKVRKKKSVSTPKDESGERAATTAWGRGSVGPGP